MIKYWTTVDFQKQMVEYLESVCAGEFLTGTLEQVQDSISAKDDANPDRTLPNLVLPEPAPEQCNDDMLPTTLQEV